MQYYARDPKVKKKLKESMFSGRVIVLYGARRVGKTTLVEELLKDYKESATIRKLNLDDPDDRELLKKRGKAFLKNIFDPYDIIFIDEIQKLAGIGDTLKMLVDEYKEDKQFIVTGSSTVMMKNDLTESLTGRKHQIILFPFSYSEIVENTESDYFRRNLNTQLIFGSYPRVQISQSFSEKEEVLDEIADSYLYKDILALSNIRDDTALRKLAKLIAFQVGSEVSVTELSNSLGLARITVENYLYLLEKNFVIFQLSAYSTNKRREIKRNSKIYFYDTGIRNAIINDFRIPDNRNDLPQLWENFVISERLKKNSYSRRKSNMHFWRTFDGAEVDLVEERPGHLDGFEIKFSDKIVRAPKKWQEYKRSSFQTINKENYNDYLQS